MTDKDEIFKEARKDALSKQLESTVKKPETKEEKLAIIKEKLESGETQWDLLKKMIEGSLTEKFIQILSNMPDRDFARNYLKLLEYVKPKMTRTEGFGPEENDTTINVQMVIVNENGEREVIEINNEEDGKKKLSK